MSISQSLKTDLNLWRDKKKYESFILLFCFSDLSSDNTVWIVLHADEARHGPVQHLLRLQTIKDQQGTIVNLVIFHLYFKVISFKMKESFLKVTGHWKMEFFLGLPPSVQDPFVI